jgi:hypothetical protein
MIQKSRILDTQLNGRLQLSSITSDIISVTSPRLTLQTPQTQPGLLSTISACSYGSLNHSGLPGGVRILSQLRVRRQSPLFGLPYGDLYGGGDILRSPIGGRYTPFGLFNGRSVAVNNSVSNMLAGYPRAPAPGCGGRGPPTLSSKDLDRRGVDASSWSMQYARKRTIMMMPMLTGTQISGLVSPIAAWAIEFCSEEQLDTKHGH